MTVPATPRRAGPYDGNGVTTAFGFSFKAFDEADVRVVELDEITSVETDATLNSDYTVALNPDQESTPGGTVNYLVAPSSDTKVTLIGNLNYEQPIDLPDGGAYRAQQVEDGMDRLAIQMQQLKEIIDRCAQVPVSSTDTSDLFESINVLSQNLTVLQTVVANIADLVALADDIADVNALAAIVTQINAVAAIASQVVITAGIDTEVVAVAAISADVQTVAANIAAILTAVANLPALAAKANSGAVGSSGLTMATSRMLGRVTASTGAIEELTAAQVTTTFVSAATDTAAGKVELATTSEASTGTDTTRAVTAAGVEAHMTANALGWGQTPQSVTGSRALETDYTNSTGRPIFVSARVLQNSGAASSYAALIVDGVQIAWCTSLAAGVLIPSGVCGIVPAGSVYSIRVQSGAMLLSAWSEVR